MKRLIIVMAMLGVPFSAFATPELKGSPEELRQFLHPNDRIVSLYGEAEEKAYSDKAIVSLVITTEDKQLANAMSANSGLRELITSKLTAAGISADDIKSSKFSTSPEYGWFGKKPDSYKVVNRMAISVTTEAQLKAVAAVADSENEIELSDTEFEHTQKDEYKNQVREQALDKVMQQKEFYEKRLGVTLTPVAFRDVNPGIRATRGAMLMEQAAVMDMKLSASSVSMPAGDAGTQPASFDEVLYKAGVYVDFKIEAAAK